MSSLKLFVCAMAMACVGIAPARAEQPYPSGPVKLIVPFAAGGGNDIVARITADHLSRALGQPVVVDNRPGAGGLVGGTAVAKAAPDGRTLLLGTSSSLGSAPAVNANGGYDSTKVFTPVSALTKGSLVIMANADLPVNGLADLIALAKSRPGKINVGVSGLGTPTHLTGELLKTVAGIDFVAVPYKGGAPMLADLLGKRIDVGIDILPGIKPHVEAGKIKIVAVLGSERDPAFPDAPTATEALPGFTSTFWTAVVAPANTPQPIVARLQKELGKIVAKPEFAQAVSAVGVYPYELSGADLGVLIGEELKKWTDVAKKAGIQVD